MYKIDISMIRNSASSLVALNEGYILYQNNDYGDITLKKDTSLNYDFIIEGNVSGNFISLFVGDTDKGTCTCNTKGLCKHEICLFFVLKDRLNELSSNVEELNKLETNMRVDKYLNSIYNCTKISTLHNIKVIPTLYLLDQLLISLEIVVDNKKYKVIDTKMFITSYLNRDEYKLNTTMIRLDPDCFDRTSRELLDLLKYLEISHSNQLILDNNLFDGIYKLYKDSILVNNGYYSKECNFIVNKIPMKFTMNNKVLSVNETDDYYVFASPDYQYIYFRNKIHVLKDKFEYYLTLKHLKNSKGKIEFDSDSYESFLINVYPHISKEINDVNFSYNLDINTYITYDSKKLEVTFKTDISEEIMFIRRENYISILNKYRLNKDNNYSIDNFDMVCLFLSNCQEELGSFGKIYLSENVSNLKINKMKNLGLSLKLEGGIVNILYEQTNYSIDEANKLFLAYKNNNRFVELKDEIIEVDYKLFDEYSDILTELNLNSFDNSKIELYQAYFLSEKFKKHFSINKEISEFVDDMVNYNDIKVNINPDIEAKLRDYQISGLKWLKVLSNYNFGGILADDMGLGKTLQIIALIDSLERKKPCIIVSPTSLIFNWESEFRKFAPHIKTKVLYGVNRNNEEIEDAIKNNYVLIMSYETLRVDINKYIDTNFLLCVIDEAQYIKNPDALKTLAVKSLKSDVRFALTGTPIENSLLDLWSIFDFVLPGYLESKNMFINKYESYNENSNMLNDLNRKTSLFMLRRLKGDVLNLEEKIENFAYSIMSKEEQKIYDSYLMDAKKDLQSSDYNMSTVLSILTRLRQIACEPRMFIENVDAPNSKMNLLMEIIEEKIMDNHKILIFSQFTSVFKYIEERLEKSNIKYLELTGKTKATDRQGLVNEFNENNEIKVFLISLKAGGSGLNLTSADVVIHFDPWWNLAAMNQATDRAHRIGQDKVVHVIKMINKDTIEEKILELQNRKKFLSDTVITEDEIVKKLNKEDLKKLLV